MRQKFISSQGVTLFVVNKTSGTPTYGDFINAPIAKCVQKMEAITKTRPSKNYKCISKDDNEKLLGGIDFGNFKLTLLFEPSDLGGQRSLKLAFNSNSKFLIGIKFDDDNTDLIFAFYAKISSSSITFEEGGGVIYGIRIEISSSITELYKTYIIDDLNNSVIDDLGNIIIV